MLLNLLFSIFSIVLISSSLMLIVIQNSIYSVVFLVLSFISASGFLFLIECEFFGLLFIIIYVSAIAILFLFVVMMLDVKTFKVNSISLKYFPFGTLVGFLFLVQVILSISSEYELSYQNFNLINSYQDWFCKIDALIEIEALGQILYTHFILQFLIVGLILTLTVLGVVILTIKLSKKNFQSQIIAKQLARKHLNALYYFK